jgi:hypothetical protein
MMQEIQIEELDRYMLPAKIGRAAFEKSASASCPALDSCAACGKVIGPTLQECIGEAAEVVTSAPEYLRGAYYMLLYGTSPSCSHRSILLTSSASDLVGAVCIPSAAKGTVN